MGANCIQDFRPISLISAPYKIISKVLSNRIREVLHEIIDGNQYAFIKGRQIVDSILIANECIEDYKGRKQKGVVLKLDLEIAYDKTIGIFWITLWLEKGSPSGECGFSDVYLQLTSLSSLMDLLKVFPGFESLRQGDPLSPFLFTLAMIA